MARRRAAVKRKIAPDPKFKSAIVSVLINHLMKNGEKSKAEKLLYGALAFAAKELSPEEYKDAQNTDSAAVDEVLLLTKALEHLGPAVELRSRRVGGATFRVPVDISRDRQLSVAIRFLIEAIRHDRKEKTMVKRLGLELVDAVRNRGISVKKRDDVLRMALANQAYAHYRWD